MRTVPHDIATTKRFHPTSRDTAAAVGNVGVEAVATVAMILWIEATCGELMAPYLESGEAGVGIRVAVDHTGPAFAGRPVEAHARVSGVEGRRIAFAVRLEQDGREVMTGEHVRAVVDLARFLGARGRRAGPPVAGPPAGVATDRRVDRPPGPPAGVPVDPRARTAVDSPTRAGVGPLAGVASDSPADRRNDPSTDRPVGMPSASSLASRPDSPVASRPDSPVTCRPDSPVASRPDSPVTCRPDSPVASRPDSPVASRPDSPVASRPDSPVASRPDSSVTSRLASPVTFFFDVHSPWSYLASTLIGPLARRHGVPILWRPIHLANLMDRIGGMRPLDQNAARVAWYRQDLVDRMARHGLAYDPHPDYPLRPSRALRTCVYATERGCADAFVKAVMRGYWSEKWDISDLAVLQAMADEVGLGPRPVADVVADARYKTAVAENTDDAIARGVFGVPSFIVQDKLFFGSDRMDRLDAALGCRRG